jgi:hypothetical protein
MTPCTLAGGYSMAQSNNREAKNVDLHRSENFKFPLNILNECHHVWLTTILDSLQGTQLSLFAIVGITQSIQKPLLCVRLASVLGDVGILLKTSGSLCYRRLFKVFTLIEERG